MCDKSGLYGFENHETREAYLWMSGMEIETREDFDGWIEFFRDEVCDMPEGVARALATLAINRVNWKEIRKALFES